MSPLGTSFDAYHPDLMCLTYRRDGPVRDNLRQRTGGVGEDRWPAGGADKPWSFVGFDATRTFQLQSSLS